MTLDVPAGTTTALVGPPAVGTAVARVLVGLAAPVTGRIMVGARDVTALPPPRRQIGYVPAGGALLPQLTVRRNIEYGQRKRERVHEVADDWTSTVVDRLELAPTLGLLPHLLSDRSPRCAPASAGCWRSSRSSAGPLWTRPSTGS
ncbi:ATP-binding cassette domain-containing protein, partial [Micromonospora profundi]|uniref:ATP-binding cassette domain-containing protein n=1 Tax=Micromonospora profundi TaxID=1420889 RepID=UPI0033B28EFD